jgi:hypothetical protein
MFLVKGKIQLKRHIMNIPLLLCFCNFYLASEIPGFFLISINFSNSICKCFFLSFSFYILYLFFQFKFKFGNLVVVKKYYKIIAITYNCSYFLFYKLLFN